MAIWRVLICVLLWVGSVNAQTAFTDVSVQSFSLGNATTGVGKGLNTISQNPATLGQHHRTQVQSQAGSYYQGNVNSALIAAAKSINKTSSWAIQLPIQYINDIPETTVGSNNKGQQLGTYSDMLLNIAATYSTSLKKLNTKVGATINATYHSIHTESAYGLNATVGTFWTHKQTDIGIALKHIPLLSKTWTTGHKETQPIQAAIGASRQLIPALLVTGDVTYDTDINFNTGVAYELRQELTLLGGIYNLTNTPQFRVGAALQVSSFKVDYGAALHSDIGMTHKVGLQFDI